MHDSIYRYMLVLYSSLCSTAISDKPSIIRCHTMREKSALLPGYNIYAGILPLYYILCATTSIILLIQRHLAVFPINFKYDPVILFAMPIKILIERLESWPKYYTRLLIIRIIFQILNAFENNLDTHPFRMAVRSNLLAAVHVYYVCTSQISK